MQARADAPTTCAAKNSAQKKKKPSAQLTAPVAKIALWRGETKRRVTTTSFHQNQFARTAMSMNMFPA